MLVIIMLEQCVVGVVGLDAAGSRIGVPSYFVLKKSGCSG